MKSIFKAIIFSQVLLLQKSNKRDLNLTVNIVPSSVVENRPQLHHNARDYHEIIRGYIDTIRAKYILYSNYYNIRSVILEIKNNRSKIVKILIFLYYYLQSNY